MGFFARAGFLLDLERCRSPAGAGAEIRYSPTNYYIHYNVLYLYVSDMVDIAHQTTNDTG